MEKITITKKQAKEFLVSYHYINVKSSLEKQSGILELFDRLQSIQYDPLDVVGRNTDLVLQARVNGYKKGMIDELLYNHRTLIDGWDKQMSVFKTSDFPVMETVRRIRSGSEEQYQKARIQFDGLNYTKDILNILKNDGPKFSSEIRMGETIKHRWGQTKPSSAAFDYLFHQGKIGIKKRRSTQKQYDLIENLIGDLSISPSPFTSIEQFTEYYLLRRIKSMGLVQNKSGVHFSGAYIDKKKSRIEYLSKLIEQGEIIQCNIEELKETFYIIKDYKNYIQDIEQKITFIAPLDNLIWDRALIKDVFDFEYTWEVYTPVIKRKYGYYVLPMIQGHDFIGRIEFKKQRKNEKLEVINMWLQPNIKLTKTLQSKIDSAINRFSKYLDIKKGE